MDDLFLLFFILSEFAIPGIVVYGAYKVYTALKRAKQRKRKKNAECKMQSAELEDKPEVYVYQPWHEPLVRNQKVTVKGAFADMYECWK